MALIRFENIIFPDDNFIAALTDKLKIVLLVFQFGLVVVVQDDVISLPEIGISLDANRIRLGQPNGVRFSQWRSRHMKRRGPKFFRTNHTLLRLLVRAAG